MIVRKLRLERGWSQETLAQVSGLNVRTVQRIERGQKAGLETLQALAAVLEVDVSDLTREPEMTRDSSNASTTLTMEEQEAMQSVRDIKGFYTHAIQYAIVMPFLAILDYLTSPGHYWFYWPLFGWGIGLAIHGLNVYEKFHLFSPEWERRQIAKRLNRDS